MPKTRPMTMVKVRTNLQAHLKHPAEPTVRDSEAFEQHIQRIHDLLEGSGVEVIWNDHIPDPDNISQRRQIDVSIKRDGKLTLVECRDHAARQDVKWIEELIGRRTSLKADAAIGVSASGFTAGAIHKANAYGIVLRDLCELTDLEIKRWAGQLALTLYFYEYTDLEASLCFERESIPKLEMDVVRTDFVSKRVMQSLFNASAQQLDTLNLVAGEHAGRAIKFGIRLNFDDLKLSGEPVVEAVFKGSARLSSRDIPLRNVVAYGKPVDLPGQREVIVERFPLGETSIIHSDDRISVLLDLSDMELPPFSQFRFFRLEGNNEVDYDRLEILGVEKLWVRGKMHIDLYYRGGPGEPSETPP